MTCRFDGIAEVAVVSFLHGGASVDWKIRPKRAYGCDTIFDEVVGTSDASNGIVDGLKVAGAKRVAVATAYTDVVNATLQQFLRESGFEVLTIRGLNLIRGANAITQEQLYDFCAGAFSAAPHADALLVSCGGLKTIDLLVPLEAQCKAPVVSSTPHALMNAVRLLGLSPRVNGYGRVLARA